MKTKKLLAILMMALMMLTTLSFAVFAEASAEAAIRQGVPAGGTVFAITFSEAMNDIAASDITVENNTVKSVTMYDGGKIVSVTVGTPFTADTISSVTLADTITAVSGNTLSADDKEINLYTEGVYLVNLLEDQQFISENKGFEYLPADKNNDKMKLEAFGALTELKPELEIDAYGGDIVAVGLVYAESSEVNNAKPYDDKKYEIKADVYRNGIYENKNTLGYPGNQKISKNYKNRSYDIALKYDDLKSISTYEKTGNWITNSANYPLEHVKKMRITAGHLTSAVSDMGRYITRPMFIMDYVPADSSNNSVATVDRMNPDTMYAFTTEFSVPVISLDAEDIKINEDTASDVELASDGMSAEIYGSMELTEGEKYTLTFGDNVLNVYGFGIKDTDFLCATKEYTYTSAEVVHGAPAGGTVFDIKFAEPMTKIDPAEISVSDTTVTSVNLSEDGLTANVNVADGFTAGTTVTVELSKNITSADGSIIAEDNRRMTMYPEGTYLIDIFKNPEVITDSSTFNYVEKTENGKTISYYAANADAKEPYIDIDFGSVFGKTSIWGFGLTYYENYDGNLDNTNATKEVYYQKWNGTEFGDRIKAQYQDKNKEGEYRSFDIDGKNYHVAEYQPRADYGIGSNGKFYHWETPKNDKVTKGTQTQPTGVTGKIRFSFTHLAEGKTANNNRYVTQGKFIVKIGTEIPYEFTLSSERAVKENNNVKYSAEVTNSTGNAYKCVAAVYSDNKLASIGIYDGDAGATNTISIPLDITDYPEASQVKIFLLDDVLNIKPLKSSYMVNITE